MYKRSEWYPLVFVMEQKMCCSQKLQCLGLIILEMSGINNEQVGISRLLIYSGIYHQDRSYIRIYHQDLQDLT
jgi:hypothetical protein